MRQLTRHKCRVYHTQQVKLGATPFPLADILRTIQGPGDIAVFERIRFPIGEAERLTRLFAQLASQAEIIELRDTLVHLMESTCLFETEDLTEDLERGKYMEACRTLIRQKKAWIRPVTAFRVKPGPPMRQFASLTRHLFLADLSRGKAGIPEFMDRVWFSSDDARAQQIFIEIGAGTDIRTLGFPFSLLTKRMVTEFMSADPSVVLTLEHAVRWAEIHALGSHRPRGLNTAFVEAVLQTRLASNFRDDIFWQNVLRFLIRHNVAPRLIPDVIDYVWYRRYEGADDDPSFSLKGRTPDSLLRLVEAWHRDNHHKHITLPRRWTHVPDISDTAIQIGEKSYVIRQLLSTEEIEEEGRVLNHCVFSYAKDCYEKKTSIWSMSEEQSGKLLTIEVALPEKHVRQCKGAENRDPTDSELAVIQKWVTDQKLHFRIPNC